MQNLHRQKKHQHGITVVEVLVGIGILTLVLIFSMHAISLFINTGRTITEKTQALFLAEEGLELVRFVRDKNWSNIGALPLDTARYIDIDAGDITITTTPEVIDEFTRSFIVRDVYRDSGTDDIVASTTIGSVADSNAKYVIMSVEWGAPATTVSLTTILTDFSL